MVQARHDGDGLVLVLVVLDRLDRAALLYLGVDDRVLLQDETSSQQWSIGTERRLLTSSSLMALSELAFLILVLMTGSCGGGDEGVP